MAAIDWSWSEPISFPTSNTQPHQSQGIANMGHYATNASQPQTSLPAQSNHSTVSSSPALATHPQWQIHDIRPIKTARKRSRDELGWDEDDSSRSTTAPFPSARHTPSPPKSSSMMDVTQEGVPSEGGIWAEELSERLRSSELTRDERAARPGLESRKSIRLDRRASAADETVSKIPLPRSIVEDPAIDEATLALGIGWSTIPANSTMDQASRGWARYIETHFPLQSVKIIWKSNLPAFLVGAVTCDGSPRGGRRTGTSAYFIFDESLSQGRMVAKSWERALDNLRSQPWIFDGLEIMDANEDELQSHSESQNYQNWAGWRARSTTPAAASTPNPATFVPVPPMTAADGMELD